MAASHRIIYNGVTIEDGLVEFNQLTVPDRSGASRIYNRYSVSVTGWIHADTDITEFGFTSPSGSIDNEFERIRKRINVWGKNFKYYIEDKLVLEADGATDGNKEIKDVNNGPKPQGLRTGPLGIAGGRIQVVVTFEIALLDCESKTTGAVISNRWSVGDRIDSIHATTRTYTGELRVSRVDAGGHNVHHYRGIITPPLLDGFQRETMNFVNGEDGLSLSYTIVDKERHRAPPDGIADWRGSIDVSTDAANVTTAVITITVFGKVNETDHKTLAGYAIAMVGNWLVFSKIGTSASSPLLLQSVNIHEELHEPQVTVSVGVKLAEPTTQLYAVSAPGIGTPIKQNLGIDWNPKKWPVPPPDGLTGLSGIFVALMQQPCQQDQNFAYEKGKAVTSGTGKQVSKKGKTTITSLQSPKIPKVKPPWNQLHLSNIYLFTKVKSRYEYNPMIACLPVAASSDTKGIATKHINYGRPQMSRFLSVSFQRLGAWPDIPKYRDPYRESDGTYAIVVDSKIEAFAKETSVDATNAIHTINIDIEYSLEKAPDPGTNWRVGFLPWDKNAAKQRDININKISKLDM